MLKPLLTAVLVLCLAGTVCAQDKKRVERAADLPRFNYKIDGKLDDLIANDARFAAFARDLRRDVESVLAQYDIQDKATQRQLLGMIVQLDFLDGRYDAALAGAARVRALQEKPADKLLSGMQLRAIVGAQAKAGNRTSDAYRRDVAQRISADLDAMPYDVVQNEIKEAKMRTEIVSEALILGNVREVLQPTVDKAGSLSSDLAPSIVNAKYALTAALPLKQTMIDTYGGYLAARKVDKPDIWAARDVNLPEGRGYAPVTVAVWDSGIDTALFPGRVVEVGGKPAVIAFDKYADPSPAGLYPLPADLRARLPQMKAMVKGFSDLQSNIDSKEAGDLKKLLSSLKPAEVKATIEEINAAANYMHGTHVAGITLAGNPYARLVNARIEFGHTMLPDPCPTKELAEKDARNMQAYVEFMKTHGVRVVNMSWSGSVADVEKELELCGVGKTPDERKQVARELFEIQRNALTRAMAGAPSILFVAAAGNANADSTFTEAIPAGIVLPNLLSVGAVDRAGDEASFTSYGPTVVVHANGYQVESVIPGGEKVAESGTSMASPQVANLAAKILAVNPKLTPAQVVAIVRDTADKTADGRRTLVNAKKALAAAEAKSAG